MPSRRFATVRRPHTGLPGHLRAAFKIIGEPVAGLKEPATGFLSRRAEKSFAPLAPRSVIRHALSAVGFFAI